VLRDSIVDRESCQLEEKCLIDRLEVLIKEFQAQFAQSRGSMREFIWGYFRQRMREECVPRENDKHELRAIGVQVEENCKSSQSSICRLSL